MGGWVLGVGGTGGQGGGGAGWVSAAREELHVEKLRDVERGVAAAPDCRWHQQWLRGTAAVMAALLYSCTSATKPPATAAPPRPPAPGSGYLAAAMGLMVAPSGRVLGIEKHPELAEQVVGGRVWECGWGLWGFVGRRVQGAGRGIGAPLLLSTQTRASCRLSHLTPPHTQHTLQTTRLFALSTYLPRPDLCPCPPPQSVLNVRRDHPELLDTSVVEVRAVLCVCCVCSACKGRVTRE